MERHPPQKQKAQKQRVWTFKDLPALRKADMRVEIFDDEIYVYDDHAGFDEAILVSPSPLEEHQIALANLHALMRRALHDTRLAQILLAPYDVYFETKRIVQPDMIVIGANRRAIMKRRGIVGPPDLIVEVLSRRTAKRDRTTKQAIYAGLGVPEYWLVDPRNNTVEVLVLDTATAAYARHGLYVSGQATNSPHFELQFAVDDIFADPFADE